VIRRDAPSASLLSQLPWLLDANSWALAPETGKHVPISGTLVLVFVFLAAFIIYYFLNWKWLAAIWLVR